MTKEVRGKYTSSVTEADYTVFFTATVSATYTYFSGRNWLSNGDPGYPSEESWDYTKCEDVEIESVEDNEGNPMSEDWLDTNASWLRDICTAATEDALGDEAVCSRMEWDDA